HPRPQVKSYHGDVLSVTFDSDLTAKLKTLAKNNNASLYMVMLSIFQLLMLRYSCQSDINVGSPVAGRNRQKIENLIGLFVNTIVLRADFSTDMTYIELLEKVRMTTLEAYNHQDIPFEKLVEELHPERHTSLTPLFQVMFTLQNMELSNITFADLELSAIEASSKTSKFDLLLALSEHDDQLSGGIEYNTDLFEETTMIRMNDHFHALVNSIVDNPQQLLSKVAMLSDTEKHQLVVEWNNVKHYPSNACLHSMFEQQVQKYPDAIAVCYEDKKVSYAELDRRSSLVANQLQKQGVGPNVLVGLCLERSHNLMIGLLAILKAGGAYVPLDPGYPQERLSFILQDADVKVIVTQEKWTERFPNSNADMLCLDTDWDIIELNNTESVENKATPTDLAYVIYTSGSTGQPKGVKITHHHVMRLFAGTQGWYAFDHTDVWSFFHSYSFDFSVWEIWGALLYGGRLVIVPYITSRSPVAFRQLLMDEKVTILNQTPSAFYQLMQSESVFDDKLESLRVITFGGEALDLQQLMPWFDKYGDETPMLVNMYGITETTVHVTYRAITLDDVEQERGSVIGEAIPDLQMYVLDQYQNPVPIGVVGEMCIAGDGVASGYLNREELTKERFIDNPFNSGTQLYRSGDLARYLANGDLEYLGRIDHQVKIRGFRIELGEIESAITYYQQTAECMVIVREDNIGDQRLVAYIVVTDDDLFDLDELKQSLNTRLPEYMVPVHFVLLEKMPLTINGKIDRKALPKPEVVISDAVSEAPQTPIELVMSELWMNVLGLDVEQIGRNDNFFELGGHSLLATQLGTRIRERLSVELPLKNLFEAPTLAGISKVIESLKEHNIDGLQSFTPIKRLAQSSSDEMVLSYAQERLWFLNQLEPNNAVYNMPVAVHLKGKLNVDAFEKAFDAVVARHQVLRMRFKNNQGKPKIQIADKLLLGLPVFNLERLNELEQKFAIKQLAKRDASAAFDIEYDWLIRATLVHLSDKHHVLLLNMHHIISDGWSMGILVNELADYYHGFYLEQPPELEALPFQYSDFSQWQREWLQGGEMEKQLAYWTQKLKAIPACLKFPTDRPRQEIQTFNGANFKFSLDQDLTNEIKQLCHQQGVTLYMMLLTLWNIQLSRYSGQTDICVGTPVAGRHHQGTEQLIGFFVNAIVMRNDLSDNPSFIDLLKQVKTTVLEAFAHQDVAAELVVEAVVKERNLSYSPIAQVAFALQNLPIQPHGHTDLVIEPVEVEGVSAKYDMTLSLWESNGRLDANIEYNTDLFYKDSMECIAYHFETLIRGVVKSPTQSIDYFDLMSPDALAELLNVNARQTEMILPLSTTQRDLYLETIFNPDTLYNSMGQAFEINQEIDVRLWRQALKLIYDNDPLFRTRVVSCDAPYADTAYQVVEKSKKIELEVIDLKTQKISDDALYEIIEKQVYRSYDFSKDELFKHFIIQCNDNRTIAVTATHHLLADGLSGALFNEELGMVYTSLLKNAKPVLRSSLFESYIYQNRMSFDSKVIKQFWQQQLANTEALDFPAPQVNDSEYVVEKYLINEQHQKSIRRFCRKSRMTPAIYFKALYGILLKTYCRAENDFAIFEISSSRVKEHLQAYGCYYQQTPHVFKQDDLSLDNSIKNYFETVRSYRRDLKDNKNISIFLQNQLINAGRVSFFYNFYNFSSDFMFLGENTKMQHFQPQFSPEQVQFIVDGGDGKLELQLHYHTDYFTSLKFLDRLIDISKQLIDGADFLGDISIINADEFQSIVDNLESSKTQLPKITAIHQWFEEQVSSTPDNMAVICGDNQLSYAELNVKANQLAYVLKQQGIERNIRVAVCCHRSVDFVVAILAVIKSGGCYIPLEPNYPASRLTYIVEDSQTKLLITQSDLKEQFTDIECPVIYLDESQQMLSQQPTENLLSELKITDLFYVIYTSGTTGQPKGVAITHRGEINLLNWYTRSFDISENDQTLLISALGFDLTQKNIFALLVSGGCVVMPEMKDYDDRIIACEIEDKNISLLNCAPSAIYPLVESTHRPIHDNIESRGAFQHLSSLRLVLLGGEPINMKKLESWVNDQDFNAEIVNTYGPTECTDIASYYRVSNPTDFMYRQVPIGRSNDNVKLLVMDENMQLVPLGIPGELCIGGAGVAVGYVNRKELTRQSFVEVPFVSGKVYKTGDLVRYLPNGLIDYIGRLDHQVKIRGLRIELGEIEFTLKRIESVDDCLVVVHQQNLIAYVIGHKEIDVIKNNLQTQLPSYMVPNNFIFMDEWPLTVNGKIDRKALPDPEEYRHHDYLKATNPVEEKLIALWEEVLGVSPIGIKDNFFALGGQSLLAVRLMSLMSHEFDQEIPLSALFQASTIEDIAKLINGEDKTQNQLPLVTLQPKGENTPIFCVHAIGGNALNFRPLSLGLGSNQPFYAFEAVGLRADRMPQNSIEAMAKTYIKSLRKTQPVGPYVLAGHSFGGLIAFEMAQQLIAANQVIDHLVLLETPSPAYINDQLMKDENDESWQQQWLKEIVRLAKDELNLDLNSDEFGDDLSLTDKINSIIEQVESSGEDLSSIKRLFNVHLANMEAMASYKANLYPGDVTLIRAEDSAGHTNDWQQHIDGKIETRVVPGGHDSMLEERYVDAIAQLFKECTDC
ncbi:MAG: amino acid adenylation domain-containing protein, partial [Methylococcales bacterium]|nr:amino acid adenylation domain-containing protein [Methylococcales bacterium]